MATTKKYVSLEKLTKYDELLKAKMATDDAKVLADSKAYSDSLSSNYEQAGAVATAKEALQKSIDTVEAKADAASTANAATQSDLDKLEALVGTLPDTATATDVVGYVNEKTAGIATDATVNALAARVTRTEKDIDAIEADYLKAADKDELSASIAAEATTARAAEQANASAIKTISDDYLKSADKTELQGNIDTVSAGLADVKEDVDAFLAAAEVGDAAIDTLKEIQDYIVSDGEAAATMTSNIAANANAISALKDKVGDIPEGAAAIDVVAYVQEVVGVEETRATGVESGLNTRLAAVESAVGSSGSVATDIATAKQEAIDAAAVDASSKDEALETKITAAYKKYADDEDAKIESRVATLETASATHALASNLNAAVTRISAAEGEIDTLQSEMDTVEAKAAANETAIGTINTELAKKASQTDLDNAVARIAANEAEIASFVEVSEEEINQLFA